MRMRTLNEAAAELGCSRNTLSAWVLSGKCHYLKWGSRYLIDIDEVGPIFRDRAEIRGMVSLKECAEKLGLSPSTLRNMALAGLVPYKKKGRYMKFDPEAVAKAIRESMVEG